MSWDPRLSGKLQGEALMKEHQLSSIWVLGLVEGGGV